MKKNTNYKYIQKKKNAKLPNLINKKMSSLCVAVTILPLVFQSACAGGDGKAGNTLSRSYKHRPEARCKELESH